jgi:NADPH2:quinone reductase
VGFAAGEIPAIPLNLALLSERSIIGVYVGAWAPRAGKDMMTNIQLLTMWLKAGKLKPRITARYSLDDAVKALQFAASRSATGKIVIEINKDLI